MRIAPALCVLAVAAAVSSCFTGIESTPRITGEDVRAQGVRYTSEQAFAEHIASLPPRAWEPGKQWKAADSRIAMIFTAASTGTDSLGGKTLTLESIDSVSTVLGTREIELVLRGPAGERLFYRPAVNTADWADRPSLAIPFAIELSAVETADSMMRDNTYYITTPVWYDAEGRAISGLRHIPVRVTRVLPGTERYPLCVAFMPPGGDIERYILMTYGPSSSATRNFDRLFSFDNPRKAYPRISDATWELIVRSQVAEGMTRDECRLALGTPASIDRGATRGYEIERWSYDNGVYLLFEDGHLTRFRI